MSTNLSPPDGNVFPDFPPRFTYKLLFSTLAAFAAFFVLDYVFYSLLTGDFFNTPSMKETPDMGTLAIGYALVSLLMAYIFFGVFNNASVLNRFLFGALLALFAFLPSILFHHALYEGHSYQVPLADLAYKVVQFGLVGIIIGIWAKVPRE